MDTTSDYANDIVEMLSSGETPYGHTGKLEAGDVLAIVDAIHSHYCTIVEEDDTPQNWKMIKTLESFMNTIVNEFDIPA